MKINQKLNFVVPVERESGTIYIHSMPISREVFEENFLVIGKTFSSIYASGLNWHTGPRVAALMLKKISQELEIWDEVQGSLVAEIRRKCNVIIPGQDTIPFQEAIDKNMIDIEDASEVENAITFFIVASAMHKRKEIEAVVTQAAKLWGAQITPLSLMAYAASLPTSTEVVNTGGMKVA